MAATSVPSKEALVIILDIGLGMHHHTNEAKHASTTTPIEEALKSVTLLFQQKLIYGKKDELGVVLVGTKGTKNNLQKDGYQHITMQSEIEEPKIETLKYLENLSPGESRGDLIDALIVAMDMLINKTEKKKYQKRIFLVTNANDPINKEDLSTLQEQFKKIDVKLNIIGVDFTDEEELENKIKLTNKEKNEKFLREFAESVNGVLVPVKQALEMMSFFRSQSVLQRTTFRGSLEIGSKNISVWGYMKTKIQSLPTLGKISNVSKDAAAVAAAAASNGNGNDDDDEVRRSMQVKQEKMFYSISDPDNEIDHKDLLKGYKYGKSLIPFSKIDESAMKYTADKCLKVIGFTDLESIPFYYSMGSSEMLLPPPNDKPAEQALSSLIHALAETNQVGLVRYVKKNGSNPYLAYIFPHIKPNYECLYLCTMPFADDIRPYQFPNISPTNANCKKQYIPSAEQLAAAGTLIDSMDLMTAEENEERQQVPALRPRYTYNPSLQHFYQCLHYRALHPSAQLPKLDPVISKYINPDATVLEQAAPAIEEFQRLFPLKPTPAFKDTSTTKYRWKDGVLVAEEIRLDSYVGADDGSKKRKADDMAGLSLDKLVSGFVNEVGSVNPVQNFKDMLARRDVDLVDKAVALMKQRIVQLVNDSLKDQFYQKALDCVVELRKGCIKESESEEFNTFLGELRDYYEGKRRDDFWQLLRVQSITLISTAESDDSGISESDALAFLGSKPTAAAPVLSTPKSDSVDDLFDQIE
ncbi:hypothetical protein SAMD00019534_016100 [Acytostelium subglobosum LB1]|uniref:hypothetical protein n=1 Tax=Acytostelium subglobosum LB1 TaxID=1410327 RepID=UPI000644DEE0|nr:hypothetical protein SAMD00019534_016100 [Acytostelium subglobosum LB1]GAM18435.1 hypothetical protein SAMD00019534_016100 [Acytostelium subglobosum LB1]|eukprot:XP_012757655.1 hypothetical protein SAMD00019534_016100 [Acytostelium subglobosum LB1]